MDTRILLEGFRKLYNRIYNPRSACPDVEIAHVGDVMADVLAGSSFAESIKDPVSRWALSYVAIHGPDCPREWLLMSFADMRVSRHIEGEIDEYGYPKKRPYEDIEKAEAQLREQMSTALQSLIDQNHLALNDGKLSLVGRPEDL